MKVPAWVWTLGGIAAFSVGLFYLSLSAAPDGPPTGLDHSADGAELACREAILDSIGAGGFPFSPSADYLGGGRYLMAGVVDVADPGGTIRNNYQCWARHLDDTGFLTDSITLWQSH